MITITEPFAPPRRKVQQKRPAFILAALMLAVPLLPMIFDASLPEREWDPAESSSERVVALTDKGNAIVVETPQGWEALDQGDSAVLRKGDVRVLVEAFDLEGRDPEAVTERLIRLHRIQGISSALDGGTVTAPDGSLGGRTCVVVTESRNGTCAFVHDGDVIVSVVSLGTPDQPALPIGQVIDLVTKDKK